MSRMSEIHAERQQIAAEREATAEECREEFRAALKHIESVLKTFDVADYPLSVVRRYIGEFGGEA